MTRPYKILIYWSDFVPNSTFYRILSGFHRTFATGVAWRQGTLTPPDTWSPGTYICSTCWDQYFSELVVIFPDYALRISLGNFSILLRDDFVIVPADKASNNYTFVCKRHYVRILSEELGLNSLPGNPTYNLTDFSASEVLDNHKSVLTSFGIETSDDELDLPYIYWIPKMHKNPYKHRFIAGSSKCSTKPLSILLTKLLTHIKQGLQKYCETAYSRSGINQMWILKNSKELLEHLKSPAFNHVTSIKSFDFSTLYTTIPHQKLKERLTSIIRNAFIFKNGNRRYKYLVLGHEETYFVKEHSDSKNKYSEDDIIKMLEFLVDNIFVVFAGKVFQQTSFCIHTKRISYSLCSQRERNI